MALHRLTSITLAVPDIAASNDFFEAFGLDKRSDGWLDTRDGGRQLQLVESPRRNLLRLGVGATDADDLERIAKRVASVGLGRVESQTADRLVLIEPATGLAVDITVADPLTVTSTPPNPSQGDVGAINSPASAPRRDRPAPAVMNDDAVKPSNLSHVVYCSPDQPTTLAFFIDVVGFEISDQIPGIIAFTRCGEVHHNLAIQAGPVAYAHHVAFEVDNVDDVAKGGTHMIDADPDRHVWGLGRHAIGSNWFWYLKEPGGTFVEYAADVDRISSQALYEAKEWSGHEYLYAFGPKPPRAFLEPTDLTDLIGSST